MLNYINSTQPVSEVLGKLPGNQAVCEAVHEDVREDIPEDLNPHKNMYKTLVAQNDYRDRIACQAVT